MQKSLMGFNCESISDWSRSEIFVDLVKQSREFGKPDKPWERATYLKDKNGWPLEDFGVVLQTEALTALNSTENKPYKISCLGKADIGASNSPARTINKKYDPATNLTTCDLIVSGATNKFNIMLSVKNTVGGIKDLKVIRPGYTEQDFITNEFKDLVSPVSVLRGMDFFEVNNHLIRKWEDRTPITIANFGNEPDKGGERPGNFEHFIDICNKTNKDCWICIPPLADDDFVRNLAELVKRRLNKDLVCYIEWGNELWNDGFKASKGHMAEAILEKNAGHVKYGEGLEPNNQVAWSWKRTGRKTCEAINIFREIFGNEKERVRAILGVQYGNTWVLRCAIDYIQRNFGAPKDFMYGFGVAPYMNIDEALAKRADATPEEILKSFNDRNDLMTWTKMKFYRETAAQLAIKFIAYEGGTDFHQFKVNVQNKIDTNYLPGMQQCVEDYLNSWFAAGGQDFVWYNVACMYGSHAYWGATDNPRNKTPKYIGVQNVALAKTWFDPWTPPPVVTLPKIDKVVIRYSDGTEKEVI